MGAAKGPCRCARWLVNTILIISLCSCNSHAAALKTSAAVVRANKDADVLAMGKQFYVIACVNNTVLPFAGLCLSPAISRNPLQKANWTTCNFGLTGTCFDVDAQSITRVNILWCNNIASNVLRWAFSTVYMQLHLHNVSSQRLQLQFESWIVLSHLYRYC